MSVETTTLSLKISIEPNDNLFGSNPKISDKDLESVRDEINSFMDTYMRGVHDMRAIVILCAMAIESEIEAILKVLMPSYEGIFVKKSSDLLDFGIKIKILQSFSVLPTYILSAADCVRKLRNDCAHDMDLLHKPDALSSYQEKIKSHLENISGGTWKKDQSDDYNFKNLTTGILMLLGVYKIMLQQHSSYVRSKEHIEHYNTFFNDRFVNDNQ